jgi:HlyD family secretion protein
MWILTSVDESDIGQIKLGQKSKFTVQAYPNKIFDGEVLQIRLNPNVVSNVVNYTVVVKADNKEKLLLPGMTATVDFYVDNRQDVLIVPNVALRFQPTDDMMVQYRKDMEKEIANMPDSLKKRYQQFMGGSGQAQASQSVGSQQVPTPAGAGNSGNSSRRRGMNRLWYLDNSGRLKMSPVSIGITDGKNSEIIRGRNIQDGMKVISGMVDNSTTSSASGTNVFNPAQQGGNRGPGGGPGRGF